MLPLNGKMDVLGVKSEPYFLGMATMELIQGVGTSLGQ